MGIRHEVALRVAQVMPPHATQGTTCGVVAGGATCLDCGSGDRTPVHAGFGVAWQLIGADREPHVHS